MSDHTRFHEDIGAYLLDALDERERRELERHLASCDECREEVELLRPAAEALPASVEQREPPPGLKAALMAEVRRDSNVVAMPSRRRPMRRVAAVAAAAVLIVGVVVAFGVAQLGGDDNTRTVAATVDTAMPDAGGRLEIADDGATLHLHDMPDLGGTRVYQVWLQHDDRMVPARTFEVGSSGSGEVELRNLGNADGVYVTREARGGASVPSEDPIVSVPL